MADSAAVGPKSSPSTFRLKQTVRMDKTAAKNVTASLKSVCATDEAAFSVENVVKSQANASDTTKIPPTTRKVLLATTRRAGQDSNILTSDEDDDDEEEEECRLQPPGLDHKDDKKRRRSDRYDSSESSDSGVTSLTCSDASSWSSSSDITEPVSPASPASSHPSPLSQTSPSEAHSPSATTHPSPSQEAEADAGGKKCEACVAARPAPAQKVDGSCNRRRRFSDSAPQTVEARPAQRKRLRRLSGSCSSSSSCEFPCVAAVASKWSAYTCLWRNKWNTSVAKGPVAVQCKVDVGTQRLSWPINRNELKKSGQLKITEFFCSQVKQHWSYQQKTSLHVKDEDSGRRIDHPNSSLTRCDGIPEACRESRVSIVSVAHVDHSVDSDFTPAVENLAESTQQADSSGRQPPSPPCSTDGSCGSGQKHREAKNESQSATTPQIRFPVDQGKSDSALVCTEVQCLWKDCGVSVNLTSGQSLLEHIHSVHVASQAGTQSSSSPSSSCSSVAETSERYVCEWEGCKVQGRTSSSRAWLERHVLTHGGNKPFRCIVESCDQRFSSQAALQRHVNAHFNQDAGQSNGGSNGIKRENGHVPAKVLRRNSKKLKNRRKTASARLFDYFDTGIMERLRHQLLDSQENQTRLGLSPLANSLTVSSQVIARRLDPTGRTRVLVRWTPEELLPDQWLLESEVVARKVVSLHTLSTAAQIKVHHMLNPPAAAAAGKQRRK